MNDLIFLEQWLLHFMLVEVFIIIIILLVIGSLIALLKLLMYIENL